MGRPCGWTGAELKECFLTPTWGSSKSLTVTARADSASFSLQESLWPDSPLFIVAQGSHSKHCKMISPKVQVVIKPLFASCLIVSLSPESMWVGPTQGMNTGKRRHASLEAMTVAVYHNCIYIQYIHRRTPPTTM